MPARPSRRSALPRLASAGLLAAMLSGSGVCGLYGATAARAAVFQDGAHIWSFERAKGSIEKYRTYMKVSGRAADDSADLAITIKSSSRHDYKDVSADGQVTFDQIDEKAEAVFNGKPVPPSKDEVKPITVTYAKNGLMVKRINPAADPFNNRDQKSILAIQSMPVPDKPVKPGDTWKADIPNPLMKNKLVPSTSTFEAVEKVLGTDALRIKLEMAIPTTFDAEESEIIRVTVTYYLDAKDHTLLRASYLIKNPVLPLPGKKMEARVLVSRIVPGQNDQNDPDGEKLIAPVK